jgi:transcriptional regulator with XRE-family HTH domain
MGNNKQQSERFSQLIEALNISQVVMAELIGYSQEYVSQIASGKRNLTRPVLQNIANKLPNVNLEWLIRGNGDMMLVETYQIEEGNTRNPEDLHSEHKADPLAGLRDLISRVEALERWKAEQESKLSPNQDE